MVGHHFVTVSLWRHFAFQSKSSFRRLPLEFREANCATNPSPFFNETLFLSGYTEKIVG